ncbi:MAG TPA: hypothetical protein VMH37_03370, partial [Candidatus Binataceae bacterium]|nr:hypothetical protein [Candidatus Binataceae bacterium]
THVAEMARQWLNISRYVRPITDRQIKEFTKTMKRTLTILTAALFAGAIAVPVLPALAQDSSASPAAEASASAEKPAKKHHHHSHKKKGEAPAAAPSDSTSK